MRFKLKVNVLADTPGWGSTKFSVNFYVQIVLALLYILVSRIRNMHIFLLSSACTYKIT